MLKVLIFAAIVAGCAANGGHFGKGKHHRRHFDDDDEPAGVRPPNCNCTKEEHKDKSHELWKYKNEDWIVKNLHGNETLDSLKQKWKLKKQICANNGVTYASKCEFVNAAANDTNIGVRCHGPCPCGEEKEEHEYKSHRRSFKRLYIKKAYCLTNGQTVYGKEELAAAKKANPSVGKRCHGECADCAADLRCPKRRQRKRREADTVAPNCVCTQKSSHRYQQFLNTTCGQKKLEKKMLCGSDNVTYANKCDFKNKQAANPGLGKRCRGKCPCDFEKFERKSHWKRNAGFGHQERSGLHKYKKEAKPFCLNNGQTVHGTIEKHEALKKNESLGVRCKGECSECQTGPIKCPLDWVKIKEEKEKARPHPPNCTCPEALSKHFGKKPHKEVCGNDNKTYANICELVNNQTTDAKLGFRCLGKCPCKNEIKADFGESSDDDNDNKEGDKDDASEQSASGSSTSFNSSSSNSTIQEKAIFSSGSASLSSNSSSTQNVPDNKDDDKDDDKDKDDEKDKDDDKDKDDNNDDRESRNVDHHRRPHHRRHRKPLCLTNGNTVRGWREVSKAFKADPSVGIRCKGHCEDCANNTKCPRFPSADKIERIKQRRETKAKEWKHWFMEATIESPEKAPNCTCPFGPYKKMHEGGEKHHMHGKHHKKDKFKMCGSNNVTYENMCELANAQAQNAGLGTRCWGACPCKADAFDLSNIKEDNKAKNFSVCLTNGKTVHSKREKYEALAADPTLGIRCMNECTICQNDIKCPRIFKPKNETDKKHFGWGHKDDNEDDDESKGRSRRHRMFEKDHQGNETDTKSFWELKKEQPSFQFGKAFDFGFEEHHGWGKHKGWGKGHGWGKGWGHKEMGHKGWGHKEMGHQGWGNKGWGHKGWGHKGWGKQDKEDCEY